MYREKCYSCFRPLSSCICKHIKKLDTDIHFVILMHPKERQKIKNNSGFMTALSLSNSKRIEGVDFTHNSYINGLIATKNCFILYPSEDALNISRDTIDEKIEVIFIIDSTWILSKKMLKLSHNLASLKKISFDNDKESNYQIKLQPQKGYLSTIESTYELLNTLHVRGIEQIDTSQFLKPFTTMVSYQLDVNKSPRF